MELVIIAAAAVAVGLAGGYLLGRGSGHSTGVREGHAKGLEAGRSVGRDEGHASLEEGRAKGFEEGRAKGFEEGRTRGVGEGLQKGRDEGYARGLAEGREKEVVLAREEGEERLRTLIEALRRGRVPEAMTAGSLEADLTAALRQGWAPRETERDAALGEAVGRVSAFLESNVREPLAGAADDAEADELRERMARALGAIQDLDSFVARVDEARQGSDLARLAQDVARDFAADQDVTVRLTLGTAPVRADVAPTALMDALYLILHNAGRFGGGKTVDLSVESVKGRATIRVRDRGPGFTEEAFSRAFDPFYSTSDEGLGLGLPHARKVIEGMGGHIELRNVPDGGAEVEISFSTN